MGDLFEAIIWGLLFKEVRGYILGFFIFIAVVVIAIFFPWIIVVAFVVVALLTIVYVFNAQSKERSRQAAKYKPNTVKNKISSILTENNVNVSADIGDATNTVKVTIEDPKTKKKIKPIVFEIKNITSAAGVARERFDGENIEIVQSKTKSGYEFEINVKNAEKLNWE